MWLHQLLKWLFPVYLVLLGYFFHSSFPGHSFLALVFYCVAGIFVCYYLIALLHRKQPHIAQTIKSVLNILLLLGGSVAMITLAIILFVGNKASESGHKYLVVLGARVYDTTPSLSLADRIAATYLHLTDHPDVIAVLSGGQGEDEGISEASCMFRELTKLGIPAERLWLEEHSTSTWENLNLSLDLIEVKTGERPARIGLLSSEYHIFRASMLAERCGVEVNGVPAPTSLFSLRLNCLLREVAGVWHYFILGGLYQ